jgi:hypothetical protein
MDPGMSRIRSAVPALGLLRFVNGRISMLDGDASNAEVGGASTRACFTPAEDRLLVELKNQRLPWQDIHKQFTGAFPHRARGVGSLQVRYCTKLKEGG